MSKFPVESNDNNGMRDAVNYLLSGPGGLGQNFAGFSSYESGFLTANFRPPFTNTTGAELFVAPISLGVSEMLDGRTWKYNFASTQPTVPFVVGQPITVAGVADSYYDGDFSPIGVAECTTDYVIARTNGTFDIVAPSSGGEVFFFNTVRSGSSFFNSVDANGKVLVNSASDRVFLSAQLNEELTYVNASSTNLKITVQITRYRGFIDNDPVNPDYRFVPDGANDGLVAQKVYDFVLNGSGTLPVVETIFTAIIDQPPLGYYWYILEVQYKNMDWDGSGSLPAFQITNSVLTQRGLSAQVVKQ